jgi:hypothetical protein
MTYAEAARAAGIKAVKTGLLVRKEYRARLDQIHALRGGQRGPLEHKVMTPLHYWCLARSILRRPECTEEARSWAAGVMQCRGPEFRAGDWRADGQRS